MTDKETIHGKYEYRANNTQPFRKIYVIGSLRNDSIPEVAQEIRDAFPGVEVFDDWFAAGPEADDYWKRYEQEKGNSRLEALRGHAARNVFEFDKRHLDEATDVVLVMPAGKSGHLELGYSAGCGKNTYILYPPTVDTDRYDVMHLFAGHLVPSVPALLHALSGSNEYALR